MPTLAAAAPAHTPPDLSAVHKGDIVTMTLKQGGQLTGLYVGRDKNLMRIVIEIGEIGVEIPKIIALSSGSPANEQFRAQHAGLDPKDDSGHWQLARWARSVGLESTAIKEGKLALALDPDNQSIHSFLGHIRLNGQWITNCEPAKAGPLEEGYGVVFELKDTREVAGVYLGKDNGQYRLGLTEGEIYVDIASIRKTRRVSCRQGVFQSLRNTFDMGEAQNHWSLLQFARSMCMRKEALAEAKIAAEMGHKQAEQFLANPDWRDPTECSNSPELPPTPAITSAPHRTVLAR